MHEINQCDCEAHNAEHPKKKLNIKRIIMSNIFVVVFLSMFIIDTIFMLTVILYKLTQLDFPSTIHSKHRNKSISFLLCNSLPLCHLLISHFALQISFTDQF